MATNSLHRGLALVMALMVLVSTSGLSIDAHFCSGKIKRINLIGKAKTCKEVAATKKSCCNKNLKAQLKSCSQGTHEKGCCSNQAINLQADLDLIKAVDSELIFQNTFLSDNKFHFIAAPKRVIQSTFCAYLNFKPPKLIGEKFSLFQVYRL